MGINLLQQVGVRLKIEQCPCYSLVPEEPLFGRLCCLHRAAVPIGIVVRVNVRKDVPAYNFEGVGRCLRWDCWGCRMRVPAARPVCATTRCEEAAETAHGHR